MTDAIRARRDAFFWANIRKNTDDECWPWQRKLMKNGYGQMRGYEGPSSCHRFAYELLVGPVPQGFDVDHICHDPKVCAGGVRCPHRSCCNPLHLEAVPRAVNVARSNQRRPKNGANHRDQTECPHGHPWDEANTHLVYWPDGRFKQRVCRACSRVATAKHRAGH